MPVLEAVMRICAAFHKKEEARFLSHLDLQRLMQRAMRRAQLPLRYSQGFNPHPLLAFASALSVGQSSDGEWLDVRLDAPMEPGLFVERLNAMLPPGIAVTHAVEVDESMPTLTALLMRAHYSVTLRREDASWQEYALQEGIDVLLAGPITVEKQSKGGKKLVDLRPQLIAMELLGVEGDTAKFSVTGELTAAGGLNAELLMRAYLARIGVAAQVRIHRICLEFDGLEQAE